MERLLAVCPPGLEALTARELHGLGLVGGYFSSRNAAGGVEFSGRLGDIYRANLRLRTAERVLLRLGSFPAVEFAELRGEAGALPWEKYLAPGRPVAFHVVCERSRLYHEGAVAERLAGAVADRLGEPSPIVKGPEESAARAQLIFARIFDDVCTISLDSSGELLHRRGYRLATAKAPLKETLACAMVLASGWDGASPLLDPFCGSGTIAIEAALLARRLAPGRARRFAFMGWPGFNAKAWDALLAGAGEEALSACPKIIASDRDEGAIRAARANAARAGVEGSIEFSCRAVSAVEPLPSPGWVVTNPPYGVRLGTAKDLRDLYARLGQVLRAPMRRLASIGLVLERRAHARHGPQIRAGSLHVERGPWRGSVALFGALSLSAVAAAGNFATRNASQRREPKQEIPFFTDQPPLLSIDR